MLIYRESRVNRVNLKWDIEAGGTYGKPRSATYSHRPPGFCEDPPSLNAKCTMVMSWISYWCPIWNIIFFRREGLCIRSCRDVIRGCPRSHIKIKYFGDTMCSKFYSSFILRKKLLLKGLMLQLKIDPSNIWINSGLRISWWDLYPLSSSSKEVCLLIRRGYSLQKNAWINSGVYNMTLRII